MKDTYGVAIVGCGVVGAATAQHILQNGPLIRSRYGLPVELAAVVDIDLTRAKRVGLPEEVLTSNLDATLARSDVKVVVELIGGTTTAFDVIERSLRSGKDVVTANKALLAHRGRELFAVAHETGGQIAFEASCGGGIPIIRALVDGLAGSRIDAMYGIVNGTCNFILSQMISKSVSYETALAEAQAQGLAEADPTLDVGGADSAHKIAIMSALAFAADIEFEGISVAGIDDLDLMDVKWAIRLGYVPKLLAIARRSASGITLRVGPSFVPNKHPLAWVSGPFNAVSVYSYPTGHTMYYGRGAGGSATSGAIVADIVSIASGAYGPLFHDATFWPDRTQQIPQNVPGEVTGRYYVRAMVEDRPGMLGELATRCGRHNISLASVHQDETVDESGGGTIVPVVFVTHNALEDDLLAAVGEINAMRQVHGDCAVISIVDEHDEQLIVH